MAAYRVFAANQEPCATDANSVHVTDVETGNGPLDNEVWTAAEVCQAIAQGDRFYLASRDILQTANLRCVLCPRCLKVRTLESGSMLAALNIHKLPPIWGSA